MSTANFSLQKEAINELKEHSESVRIKKLIFAACKDYWENDPAILYATPMEDLIAELRCSNPTIKDLSTALHQVVRRIKKSKRGIYSFIANIAILKLSKLYSDVDKSTQSIFFPSQDQDLPEANLSLLKQAVKTLTQDEEMPRIQKLVFATCKGYWENDLEKLAQYKFETLLSELYQIHATKEQLALGLFRVVKTLNRQAQYFLIAKKIIGELSKLYEPSHNKDFANTPVPSPNPKEHSYPKAAKASTAFAHAQAVETSPKHENKSKEAQNQHYDRYRLRLKVMKASSPLRAKALIFSALHHQSLDVKSLDGLLLKTYKLDDLLWDLLKTCGSAAELERRLEATAKSLENPEENLRTARAILQTLAPLYA